VPSPILLLGGMTPDARIFDQLLPRLANASVVPWIEPKNGESLEHYGMRLAKTLTISEPVVLCAVSFGGVVAIEVARWIDTKGCVLISSIRHPRELPPWLRMWRWLGGRTGEMLLNGVGTVAKLSPRLVRSRGMARLSKLAGQKGRWHRWATSAVWGWNPDELPNNASVFQIHGDRDATFPIQYLKPDAVIRGGDHVMALTHAARLAELITEISRR
jgi:hypothetical protein